MQSSHVTKWIVILVSIASLLGCLGSALAVFSGNLSTNAFKWTFLIASILWFVAATAWSLNRPGSD